MFAARGLLAAATDTNFCAFALTEHFHEQAEPALLSLANARPDLKLLRFLQSVLASLEDLEIIMNMLRPALPAIPAMPIAIDLVTQLSV